MTALLDIGRTLVGSQAAVVLGAGVTTYLHDDFASDKLEVEALLRVMETARLRRLMGDPLVIACWAHGWVSLPD